MENHKNQVNGCENPVNDKSYNRWRKFKTNEMPDKGSCIEAMYLDGSCTEYEWTGKLGDPFYEDIPVKWRYSFNQKS